jgi:hypothetical protein
MLDKAKARNGTKRPDDILILCDRPEDLQARIDVLVEDGKLTEADRPRCIFWADSDDWDGTHDGWVLMMDKNETDEERLRGIYGTSERAQANLAIALQALRGRKRQEKARR